MKTGWLPSPSSSVDNASRCTYIVQYHVYTRSTKICFWLAIRIFCVMYCIYYSCIYTCNMQLQFADEDELAVFSALMEKEKISHEMLLCVLTEILQVPAK